MTSVSIIGSGAWGTALAAAADRAGSQVTLYSVDLSTTKSILEKRINPECFGDQKLSDTIHATSDLEEACQSNIIILAVPAQVVRKVSLEIEPFLSQQSYILIASKGIEQDSGMLMSEVLDQTIPEASIGVLSGPTFAEEVFQGLPTAFTLAANELSSSTWLARAFNGVNCRVYASDDVIGAQIGGALKNVLAIACGLVEGRQMGENARALVLARGLAEMIRLAVAKGGRAETLSGLSGLGDICLTCTSRTSRNYEFGYQIGKKGSISYLSKRQKSLVEGFYTSKIIAKLCEENNIDMPIASAVHAVLHEGADIKALIEELLNRPPKAENIEQAIKEA